MNKPLTSQQLEAMKRQRLNGRELRIVATAEAVASDRDRIADDLRRMQNDLGQLERARPDREKVLVIVEGDGQVSVIAEQWVDVKVIHLAKVDPASAKLMDLAESIASHQLPAVYRELWEANPKPRAIGNVKECQTPAELAKHQQQLDAHAIVDRILRAIEPKEGVK